MTQELIYTSAPKGLQLGSRGFCTVACTAGMSKPLADRLEALSGYKHLYPPGSESAHLNPVNHSFVTFKLGGKTYYVLSRIADAGLDHTQRSNKLAHHVVLEGSELPPAGPACLMRQSGFFVERWEGEPRTIEARRLPLSPDSGPRRCDAWKSLTGDAGWAGVLAENSEVSGSMDANLIFAPPGENLLSLVEEAQLLLPPSKRWGATFSTFYSKLPPGVECHWRFIPRDSVDAAAARRSHGTLLVDIQLPGQIQQDTELIVAARTGHIRHSLPEPRIPDSELESSLKRAVPDQAYKQEVSANDWTSSVGGVSSVPPIIPKAPKLPVTRGEVPSLIKTKPRRWMYIGFVAGILLLASGIGYLLSLFEVANQDKSRTIVAGPSPESQHAKPFEAPVDIPDEKPETVMLEEEKADDEMSDPDQQVTQEVSTVQPPPEVSKDPSQGEEIEDSSKSTVTHSNPNASAESVTEVNKDALNGILHRVALPSVIRSQLYVGSGKEALIGSIVAGMPPVELALVGLSPATKLVILPDDQKLQWSIVKGGAATSSASSVRIASIFTAVDESDSSGIQFKFSWQDSNVPDETIEELENAGLILSVPSWSISKFCAFNKSGSDPQQEASPIVHAQLRGLLRTCSNAITTCPRYQGISLEARFSGLPGIDAATVFRTGIEPEEDVAETIGVKCGPGQEWLVEISMDRRKKSAIGCTFKVTGEGIASTKDSADFESQFKAKVGNLKANARAQLGKFKWRETNSRDAAVGAFDSQAQLAIGNYQYVMQLATDNSVPAASADIDEAKKAHQEDLAQLAGQLAQISDWQMAKDALDREFAMHLRVTRGLLSRDNKVYAAKLFQCGEF